VSGKPDIVVCVSLLGHWRSRHRLQADVTCTQPQLGAGLIKVIVVGSEQSVGLLMTANVKMPFSEPDD
jgi:hypothetical protein